MPVRKPDHELKVPRRKVLYHQTKGEQLDIKEPSERKKKRWKPLVDKLIGLVLTNRPGTKTHEKNKIDILLKEGKNFPKDWPNSNFKKQVENGVIYTYNSDILLFWLWQRKLSPVNPNMLYIKRMAYLTRINLMLDSLEIKEYNVDYGMEIE